MDRVHLAVKLWMLKVLKLNKLYNFELKWNFNWKHFKGNKLSPSHDFLLWWRILGVKYLTKTLFARPNGMWIIWIGFIIIRVLHRQNSVSLKSWTHQFKPKLYRFRLICLSGHAKREDPTPSMRRPRRKAFDAHYFITA